MNTVRGGYSIMDESTALLQDTPCRCSDPMPDFEVGSFLLGMVIGGIIAASLVVFLR